MERLYSMLQELMLLPGISGYEHEVAGYMIRQFRECTDHVEIDRAGNVIGKIKGARQDAPKVMVFAHMDQVGMVITRVCDNGLLRVTKNGSVPDKILPGCELQVRTLSGEYLPAAVAVKSHHAMTDQDRMRVEPISELYVDMGLTSREEVNRAGIYVGCAVQYKPNYVALQGERIAGTAIDNRMGCAVMLAAAQYLYQNRPDAEIYFVATVQEEHNLRGGMIAANRIKPDIALCLDVTLDSTQPGMEEMLENAMGSGPSIGMYSFHGRGTLNGTIAHEGLAKLAQEVCDELQIHLNRFAMRGLLTDSAYVQLEGEGGTATLDLGIPIRYAHSPMEVCDRKDIRGLCQLLCGMLSKIKEGFDCSRIRIERDYNYDKKH